MECEAPLDLRPELRSDAVGPIQKRFFATVTLTTVYKRSEEWGLFINVHHRLTTTTGREGVNWNGRTTDSIMVEKATRAKPEWLGCIFR